MSDEIRAQLIVEAIAKGFPNVVTGLQGVATATQAMTNQLNAGGVALNKAEIASKKLAEQNKKLAEQNEKLAQQAKSLATIRSRMAEVGKQQEAQLAREAQKAEELSKAYLLVGAAMVAAAAVSTKFLAGTIALAARVETLGVVTEVLGHNLGMTTTEMRELEEAVMSQGITMQAARGSLALMVQANIDLSKATDLARLAQDAAVIANVNSSESFERLVYVISSGNVLMARRMGLMVDFQGAYVREAEAIGKTSLELTAQEKTMARTNEVMVAGSRITGAYANAMETAGKKATSMARFIEEAERVVGEAFLPTYSALLTVLMNSLQAWTDLEKVTQRQVSAGAAVATAWTGMVGAGLLLLSILPKIKAGFLGIGAVAALGAGWVLAFAAAIGVGIAALAASAAKTQAVAESLAEIEQQALDTGKSYEEYVKSSKKLAEENNRVVYTFEEMQFILTDVGARAREADKSMSNMATDAEILAGKNVLMSKTSFELAQTLIKLRMAGDDSSYTLNILTSRTMSAEEKLELLEGRLKAVTEAEEALAEENEIVAQAFDDLATLVSGPVLSAMEDYADGSEDAIQRVIYSLLESNDTLRDMGLIGAGALAAIGEGWGMLDQNTARAKNQLQLFLDLFAKDNNLPQLRARVEGLRLEIQNTGVAAGEATPNIITLLDSVDRDIANPMAEFQKSILWFLGGGLEIAAQFQGIMDAMSAGKITPEQAYGLLEPLIEAASDIKVDLNLENLDEASESLAEALNIGIDEARDRILSTDGLVGALEKVGETEIGIKMWEDFNEKREETEKALIAMGTEGKYDIGISYEGLTEAQKERKTLEDDLIAMTAEDAGWALPFDYQEVIDAREIGLSELTGELETVTTADNRLLMDYENINLATGAVQTLWNQLATLTATPWTVNIGVNQYQGSGGGGGGYIPPITPPIIPPPPPPPPPGNCFTGATKINVPSDDKHGTLERIDNIQLGDMVYAYDEINDEVIEREVIQIITSRRDDLVTVHTEFGEFHCSPNHRWYTELGWVEAANLTGDDRVLGLHGLWVLIHSVVEFPGEYQVFNLTVDEFHNYFVMGQLVHNYKFAGGVQDFVVPPGFYEPQRPYTVGVSSGERVSVQRAGEAGEGGNYLMLNAHLASDLDVPSLVNMIVEELGNRLN